MIVLMRTKAQAERVADLTGGKILLDKGKPTSKVRLDGDFEQYRAAVESVSVLFELRDDTGEALPSGQDDQRSILRGAVAKGHRRGSDQISLRS